MRTKSHYRRISKTALSQFRTKVKDPEATAKPSEEAALGTIGAVVVGTELGGYRILEVVGSDRDGLPGELCAETFQRLTGAARSAVRRAKVRELVEDPETGETVAVLKWLPENAVDEARFGKVPDPEKDEVVAKSLEDQEAVVEVGHNPHRFI